MLSSRVSLSARHPPVPLDIGTQPWKAVRKVDDILLRDVNDVTSVAELLSLEIIHMHNRAVFGDNHLILRLCEIPEF